MSNLVNSLLYIIGGCVLIIMLIIISVFIVMYAWNHSLVLMFGWKLITWWQSFWLSVLITMFSSSIHYGGKK